MKIPKSIKIGGHTVTVKFPYKFKETTTITAQCDVQCNEIRISGVDSGGNEKAKSSISVDFIHEVLHRIDSVSGHNIFSDNEPAMEGISEGIYQVLVDNGYLKE